MRLNFLVDSFLRLLDASEPKAPLVDIFRSADGTPDALRCAQVLVDGRGRAERLLQEVQRRRGATDVEATARAVVDQLLDWNAQLTGAEVIAVLLAAADVENVFAYVGTSELALCDAVERADGVRLINGRGDKESAFMAAGASLLKPNRGVALLHGARGLTNAAGGVADARRNEVGTMFVVGLPSSGSARFLPPHGEPDLLGGMSAFADWSWEAPGVPKDPTERHQAALRFVTQFRSGLARAATPPNRPAIFGIPQDVAEQRWIALDELMACPTEQATNETDAAAIEAALRELKRAKRPLFLVDDYALRFPGIREPLDQISRAVGGAVLQLRYRRGPMLFERLRQEEVANFVGWLNQFSTVHAKLFESCDLLVTVEDRNIYERVVGRLPACPKVAINSDPEKVRKNEYLGPLDTLIAGFPDRILAELARRMAPAEGAAERQPWFPAEARRASTATLEAAAAPIEAGRRAVARALARVLAGWSRPVLVDDSQMFGGLLSEHYDEFPRGLRVFGGHGGFVGGGLPYATGLAIAHDDVRVMCTLGDQAFTNALQGLVAALERRARVLFVVCNNGEAVSLKKQALASYGASARSYLSNVQDLRYCEVAEAFGIPSEQVIIPIGGSPQDVDTALDRLSRVLEKAARSDGPGLVEIVLPSDPSVWRGIWLTQGFEQVAPLPSS